MADVKVGARRRQAEVTRRRIVRAAHREFVEKGFHGATVVSIARRARVAPQTVYFVFRTKPALLSAVIDAAVMGDEDPVAPEQTAWWQAMEAEPRAAESLRLFVRGAAPLFARAAAVSEILRAAALTDPEVRTTYDHHERLRRDGFRRVVETVAAKGTLAEGLDLDTATDILMTVFGDATYHVLTTEHGWSHDRLVAWLCDALPRLLVAP